MRWKPVVVESEDGGGSLVVAVGHPLADDYLEFLRARARPATVQQGQLRRANKRLFDHQQPLKQMLVKNPGTNP